jgi:hypothetical protein
MRRQVRDSCVLLALPTAFLVAYVWLRLEDRGQLTHANFDRIRDGMTLAEVTEILGPPTWQIKYEGVPFGKRLYARWESPSAFIAVYVLDAKGVYEKDYIRKSLADQLRTYWTRTFRTAAPF